MAANTEAIIDNCSALVAAYEAELKKPNNYYYKSVADIWDAL